MGVTNVKKRIIAIVSLGFALPLLLGGSFVYAGVSEMIGDGDIASAVRTPIHITGDGQKFEEDYWTRKSVTGGISDFNLIKEYKGGTSIELEGRALFGTDDYLFDCKVEKEGLGEINFEFKQFRKYYDGTGGFYAPFRQMGAAYPSTYVEINRDLSMNIGEFKIEGVLAKENQPKITTSYMREYKKGEKSLISWGPVVGANLRGQVLTRYINPTFMEVDEIVDKINMKVEHTIKGMDVSAEQTWEKIKGSIQKVNNRSLNLGTGRFTNIRYKYEDLDADIYTTVLRIAKEVNEKINYSTTFLFNHYRGHTIETITDTSTATTNENNPNSPANIHQNMFTILPKVSILLTEDWTMNGGVKWEFVNKQGEAEYNRDRTVPPDGIIDEIMLIKTENNENKFGESIDLKYDGIENVIIYTGADFEQQGRSQDEKQNDSGNLQSNSNNFGRDADIISYNYDANMGFKWYPVSGVDITTDLKYSYALRDFDNGSKINQEIDVRNGYRGYLDNMAFTTYKPTVTANFKPFKWFTSTFRYMYTYTSYAISTRRAEEPEWNQYRSHIYSTSITLSPYEPLYTTFAFQKKTALTHTQAANNGAPRGVINLPAYNGNVNTLSTSFGYTPIKKVTLKGSYSISLTHNFNDYSNIGIPLGLDNYLQNASIGVDTKINADSLLGLRYDLMQYDETSNGGIDNYIAHVIYADLKVKF